MTLVRNELIATLIKFQKRVLLLNVRSVPRLYETAGRAENAQNRLLQFLLWTLTARAVLFPSAALTIWHPIVLLDLGFVMQKGVQQ
jgi:hypothetical protein